MKKIISIMSFVMVFISLVILTSVLTIEAFANEDEIVFVGNKEKENSAQKYLTLVYTEALERLGKKFVFKMVPGKRASAMTDTGKADAEITRIYEYGDSHPNVTRVEEPHYSLAFVALTMDSSIKLEGWESLVGTDYVVEYRLGNKMANLNLPGVVKSNNLSTIGTVFHGLKKLVGGRTDIFVEAETDVITILKTDEFKNAGIKIAGVMEKVNAYSYLNNKHKDLAPKLSATIKDMKETGLLKEYRKISGFAFLVE